MGGGGFEYVNVEALFVDVTAVLRSLEVFEDEDFARGG